LETLDGQKRELQKGMLVIADSKKPLAVAGIMGGADSEISPETTGLILESANFEPIQTRKTAQALGLRTESSARFEKSLDPNLCQTALVRAVELIKEFCPSAKVVSEVVDIQNFKLNQGPIKLDLSWLNKRIGEDVPAKTVKEILIGLGFGIDDDEKNILSVTVPTWRATKDVSIREDLFEEVARIYGYDNITSQMPRVLMESPEINPEVMFRRNVRNILSRGAALTEVVNYSFTGEDQLTKTKVDFSSHIKLANPIVKQHTMLRQSLVPNLLENIKFNQAKYDEIGIFEIGSVYLNFAGNINKDEKKEENLPFQEKRLGVLIAGNKSQDVFSQAKGVIEYLAAQVLSREGVVCFEPVELCPGWADDQIAAKIMIQEAGQDIGVVAKIDKQVAKALGIKKEVAAIEVRLKDLLDLSASKQIMHKELPKYPPVVRDLAFVVSGKMLYNNIKKEMEDFHDLIKSVDLFDVYQGESLDKNKKSLAFHVIYQAADRTLTAEEVDKVQVALVKKLQEKFEAQIRDF